MMLMTDSSMQMPDVDDQIFAFEYQDASFGAIDDVSSTQWKSVILMVLIQLFTSQSYYIDNPDDPVALVIRFVSLMQRQLI